MSHNPKLDHSKRMQWSIDLDDARKALDWMGNMPASKFTVAELFNIHEVMRDQSTILGDRQVQSILFLAVSKGFIRSTEKGNPS